jgi:hypothetical protein
MYVLSQKAISSGENKNKYFYPINYLSKTTVLLGVMSTSFGRTNDSGFRKEAAGCREMSVFIIRAQRHLIKGTMH